MDDVRVIGEDTVGVVAEVTWENGAGMRYYLTDCCGASAKGVEWGTACRACYGEIDPALGSVPVQNGDLPTMFAPETGGLSYDLWKHLVIVGRCDD